MSVDRRLFLAGALAGTVGLAGRMPEAQAAVAMPKSAASGHVFKVGDIAVTAVHDGTVAFPRNPGFITNLSDAETAKAFTAVGLPADKLTLSFTAFLVATKSNLILFDTGFHDNGGPTTGQIVANLAALGIKPGDIDTVVFSHFHGDHINGVRSKAGELVYPNAELVVPAKEWAFWMDDANMSKAPEGQKGGFQGVRRVFAPVADKVRKIDWGKEILPGITALQADGHTPGHTAYLIASGNDQMIYAADTVNNPAIFARNPDLKAVFDMDGDRAVATRKALFDRAAADHAKVGFYHGAFPSTGHLIKSGSGYEVVPAFWE